MTRVVVAGAGWAGLAAAAELSLHGIEVALLESGPAPGGRARRLEGGLDNGRHMLLGAYRETLALLRRLGVEESAVLDRTPLQLRLRSTGRDIRLRLPHHPAPLHLIGALQDLSGFSLGEKLRAVRLGLSLARHRVPAHGDVDVARWLAERNQTAALIHEIWEPLCLATLNTPAAQASAEVFLTVMHDAFLRSRDDSDLLLPRESLGAVLPEPAVDCIRAHGGALHLNTPAAALVLDGGRIAAVQTPRGTMAAAGFILALPYAECRRLTAEHPPFRSLARRLGDLTSTGITTVYLRYKGAVTPEAPFLGIIDPPACWIFGVPGGGHRSVAAVLTGPNAHPDWDDTACIRRVAAHVGRFYPQWSAVEGGVVVREPQAVFTSRVGVNACRPVNATPLPNCWIAGDYTATGYPASLESAVASGVAAARGLMEHLYRAPPPAR